MNDEVLNISYIQQAIDQVMADLNLPGDFLTQPEKLKKIKSENNYVHEQLMKLIDKGMSDSDFGTNRSNLLKSLNK